eukprot:TRINITY_DN1566_c0_g1_i1.p4 TRINITY_DN1566_c0_g1~~TRINITY_DN1566_c0_g1_i1.p4  ORF type:complete len:228 (-),score=-15.05 TRINITY_DN1566_c0_g1_i1:174-857(-)
MKTYRKVYKSLGQQTTDIKTLKEMTSTLNTKDKNKIYPHTHKHTLSISIDQNLFIYQVYIVLVPTILLSYQKYQVYILSIAIYLDIYLSIESNQLQKRKEFKVMRKEKYAQYMYNVHLAERFYANVTPTTTTTVDLKNVHMYVLEKNQFLRFVSIYKIECLYVIETYLTCILLGLQYECQKNKQLLLLFYLKYYLLIIKQKLVIINSIFGRQYILKLAQIIYSISRQ